MNEDLIRAGLVKVWAVLIVFFGAMTVGASVCVIGNNPPQPPMPPPTAPPCMPPLSSTASGSTSSCPTCAKSPCYLSSGTYAESYADLQIPTAGMYPLNVSRRYDSGRPVDGPMGVGWSSTLTAHLYYAAYLQAAPNSYTQEADIMMPSGAFYRFSASGSSFVSPPGTFDTLVKNADNTYSLTLAHTRSVYRFNTDGSLASLTDDYGNATTYSYDGSGRLYRVTDAAGSGRYLQVAWNGSGRIGSVTDNAGRVITYTYAGDGTLIGYADPIASANPPAQTTGYTYIAGRFGPLLSRIEDRWHRTISNLDWYPDGRLKSYTEGDYNEANPALSTGEKYTYAYGGTIVVKADSLGSKVYSFGANGVTNDDTRTFDPITGMATRVTEPSGDFVYYTYNGRGNVATVAPQDWPTWTYNYDSNFPDQVTSVTSSAPNQWAGRQYAYNTPSETPAGALKSVSRIGSDGVAQVVESYIYDMKGHVTTATDADGRHTFYVYNTTGDVTFVSNNGLAGPGTSYNYDGLGRVTKVTTPRGNFTVYTYDDDDRVKTITPPSPGGVPTLDFTTRMSYDNYDSTTGLVSIVTTDPNGHTTARGYDALGHLWRSVDAMGNATLYTYQYNLLRSITDANANMTSYDYDVNRYLSKTTFFDGTFESYGVTPTGGVISVTDRKGTTAHYTYDHNRITYIAYGAGFGIPYVSYSYGGQSLATVTDGRSSPAITISYDYDSQWRLAKETEAAGVITYSYLYPAGEDLASYRLDPPRGQTGTAVTAGMTYDSLGRLGRIDWSPVAGGFVFAYNDDGQYASVSFPNGQRRTFAYDNQGRLTSVANLDTQAHNLVTYNYGYDYDWVTQTYTSLGNRTSVAVSGSSSFLLNGTNKYMYDSTQQLTGVTRLEGANVAYAYDAIGNRTSMTVNGFVQPYTYYQNSAQKNTPRMQNPGALTYDANGNVTSGGYAWDAANRLSAISATLFQYDALNRRAVSYFPSPGPGTVNYVSLGLNTIAERSSNAARSNDYVFGPGIDEPLARRASDGTIQYYVVDGLGSIAAMTSPSGQIWRTVTYDEWGTVTSGTVDLFGYAGREIASLSGGWLWYNRARHYAANWGRFLSEDPDADDSRAGQYTYAANDPISLSDPLGLTPITNNTSKPIAYKPETCSGTPCPILLCAPGHTCDVDGIYPPDCKSLPIKIVNGCKGSVLPNGKIVMTCPLLSYLVQSAIGGQVDPAFMHKHKDWASPQLAPGCQKQQACK